MGELYYSLLVGITVNNNGCKLPVGSWQKESSPLHAFAQACIN
jgi:hypothetical protein